MRLDVIDLFAGAGGFGLGFIHAGFNVGLSVEVDKWATDTLRHNHPEMRVLNDDIRKYSTEDEIRSVVRLNPDVIIGGPPCQGFSISGPAQKDPTDPRNALFMDFASWVRILRPKAFVMENVKGLLSRKNAKNRKVIDIITETFEDLGYCISIWILNSVDYGVPQARERVFIVGTLDRKLPPPPITHMIKANENQQPLFNELVLKKAPTLWDAISDLPELQAREGQESQNYTCPPKNAYQESIRANSHTLFNHVAMNHTKRVVERFKQITWGESSADVAKEYGPRKRNNKSEYSIEFTIRITEGYTLISRHTQ